MARVFGQSPSNSVPNQDSMSGSEDSPSGGGGPSVPVINLKRFYTCPLDQVAKELEVLHGGSAGLEFSRMFKTNEGKELVFSEAFHTVMKMLGQSIFRVSRNRQSHPEGKI